MSEPIKAFLSSAFTQGMLTGLGLAALLWVWIGLKGWMAHRAERRKLEEALEDAKATQEKLQEHLHTQMEITAKGNEEMKKENEELRARNENLRVTNQALQQKPDSAKLRQLEIWQRAIERMQASAPGFAAAWIAAEQAAEQEVAETESGLRRFVRKFLGGGKSSAQALPENTGSPAHEVETED